jgi:class 3 adenylate cyclase
MARDLEVAILFADVVGSTQLYDEFGDTKASETVALCLDVMKDATYQFNGTVIKTIGDEVMSTFESVDDAMGAAVMMQSRVTSETNRDDGIPVSIRIGCHYGPVVQEQNDIFGAAVHTANRMTSQAKAKQIVISGFTVEKMSPELRACSRPSNGRTRTAGRRSCCSIFAIRRSKSRIGASQSIWAVPTTTTWSSKAT